MNLCTTSHNPNSSLYYYIYIQACILTYIIYIYLNLVLDSQVYSRKYILFEFGLFNSQT